MVLYLSLVLILLWVYWMFVELLIFMLLGGLLLLLVGFGWLYCVECC